MANSLKFNGIDFSTYGLLLLSRDIPFRQEAIGIQLPDKAYADRSKILPTWISLAVEIIGDDADDLKEKVDVVKRVLSSQVDGELTLDVLADRYWLARFESLTGSYKHRVFAGTLNFICYDPHAYGEEIISPYTIPGAVIEETGGTAKIEPIYTLTANANLGPTTVGILNTETGMALEWTGNFMSGNILIIDCQLWLVKFQGAASMPTVDGQFPYLLPGQVNELQISGFSGSLEIKYRNRYV